MSGENYYYDAFYVSYGTQYEHMHFFSFFFDFV